MIWIAMPTWALDRRRRRKRPIDFKGIQASARLTFCSAIFFSLETFPDFPNFFGNRKEVLEALMTMGELFAVAILSSVIFALAAHWQNDSDGGLT
jgi:hypothetical protein